MRGRYRSAEGPGTLGARAAKGYFDPQDRIVLKDLQGVLDWHHSVGMIKTPMKASSLLDERFVIVAQ